MVRGKKGNLREDILNKEGSIISKNKKYSVKELTAKLDDLEDTLENKDKKIGLLEKVIEGYQHRNQREYDLGKYKSNTLRFAAIGDTHIGNLCEKTDALESFYKLLKQEKIKTVFHAGDILDGFGVYKGQEYDQYAFGFTEQLEALEKKYPRIDGINTFFILGNHDLSFLDKAGIDVGKVIQKTRPDLIYLGRDVATVSMTTFGGQRAKYQLIHPGGGTAYAISYRSQKTIEAYSGGEKPRGAFIGHFHKADFLPAFRNVRAIQTGCFQSQTSFMLRKSTPAHVGGWIIEDTVLKPKGLSDRFKAEFIAFYQPTEVVEIDKGYKEKKTNINDKY